MSIMEDLMGYQPEDNPKSETVVEKIKKKMFPSEKDLCLKRIQDILKEYNYLESDIPVTTDKDDPDDYWNLKNKYRGMV